MAEMCRCGLGPTVGALPEGAQTTGRAGNTNTAIAVSAYMVAGLTDPVAVVVDRLPLNTRARTGWRRPSGNATNGGQQAGCGAGQCAVD